MLRNKFKFLKKNKIFFNTIYKVYIFIINNKMKEKRLIRLWGKNPNKTIYIIRRYNSDTGFFSNFFYVLGHIVYAADRGWIPVVDMEHYKTLYNEDKAIKGTKNAWEYYFEQPEGITINDAYKSKNAILSSSEYLIGNVPIYTGKDIFFPDKAYVKYIRFYLEKFIKTKKYVLDYSNNIFDSLGTKSNVLGIHYRGTDMRNYPDHPKTLEIQNLIDKIKDFSSTHFVDTILVCTDEQEAIEKIKKVFGGMVHFTNAYRAEQAMTTGIHMEQRRVRDNHRYLLGFEVLVDMLVLSKCDYLMCGHSNVSYASIIFNDNKYKDIVLLN